MDTFGGFAPEAIALIDLRKVCLKVSGLHAISVLLKRCSFLLFGLIVVEVGEEYSYLDACVVLCLIN